MGHIWLYRERGRGGEGERDGHHKNIDEGPRVSTKDVGLKDRGQKHRD